MKYNERGKSRIEVSDILNYFKDIDSFYNDCTRYNTLKRMLEDIVAETKEDAERKTGRWVHDGYAFKGGIDWMHCSECGHKDSWSAATRTPFCAWCGAKMEVKNEAD